MRVWPVGVALPVCGACNTTSVGVCCCRHHRRALVERMGSADMELSATAVALSDDSKNYHAWSHRCAAEWRVSSCGVEWRRVASCGFVVVVLIVVVVVLSLA